MISTILVCDGPLCTYHSKGICTTQTPDRRIPQCVRLVFPELSRHICIEPFDHLTMGMRKPAAKKLDRFDGLGNVVEKN